MRNIWEYNDEMHEYDMKRLKEKQTDAKRFERGEIDQVIYHGGCHGCNSQLLHGLHRCDGCQYKNANWDKPDLKDKTEVPKSILEKRKAARNIKRKQVKNRLVDEKLNNKVQENPWDNMDEKIKYLMNAKVLPDEMKFKSNVVSIENISQHYTLPEYIAKLVSPWTRDGYVASEEFLKKIITEGINSYNESNNNKNKDRSFCKVKE